MAGVHRAEETSQAGKPGNGWMRKGATKITIIAPKMRPLTPLMKLSPESGREGFWHCLCHNGTTCAGRLTFVGKIDPIRR